MKVLITQLGCIGDMILLTPLFVQIKNDYPDALIDLIASKTNHHVIDYHPLINHVFIFDKSPSKLLKFIFDIRNIKYDIYIDPKDHISTESRIIAKICRAQKKVGFQKDNDKIFSNIIPSDKDNFFRHSVHRNLNAGKIAGFSNNSLIKPKLFPGTDSINYLNHFINTEAINNYIVINLSAGGPHRIPETNFWKDIVKYLSKINKQIVLSYVGAESEIADELSTISKNVIKFKSRSINDVTALISKASLLISPDTSLIHIASAFDTPVIGLYEDKQANINKFLPLSSNNHIIINSNHEIGLKEIHSESVINILRKIGY